MRRARSSAAAHPALVRRTADAALIAMPIPLHILDVGCGDGRLLGEFIVRVPDAELYIGVDPLPDPVGAAQRAAEPQLGVVRAVAEALPFADASFDLVVTTLSFEHWSDRQAGTRELARVLADHGSLVLVAAARGRSAQRKITQMLGDAGMRVERAQILRRSWWGRPSARAFIASL